MTGITRLGDSAGCHGGAETQGKNSEQPRMDGWTDFKE